jgi:hypothetical protein
MKEPAGEECGIEPRRAWHELREFPFVGRVVMDRMQILVYRVDVDNPYILVVEIEIEIEMEKKLSYK